MCKCLSVCVCLGESRSLCARVWFGCPSLWARRVLRDLVRAGRLCGRARWPCSLDRARAGGRRQRIPPRLCLHRGALGVLRLCVTLAGVRAGAGGGVGEGSGGRGFLLRSRPRPPAYWLSAAALWRARWEMLGRERSSENGRQADWGRGAPLSRTGSAARICPRQTSCHCGSRPCPVALTATAHGHRFLLMDGCHTCRQVRGWVPPPSLPCRTPSANVSLRCASWLHRFLALGPREGTSTLLALSLLVCKMAQIVISIRDGACQAWRWESPPQNFQPVFSVVVVVRGPPSFPGPHALFQMCRPLWRQLEGGLGQLGQECPRHSVGGLSLSSLGTLRPHFPNTHIIWGPQPPEVGLWARVFSLLKGADPVVSSLGDFRLRGLGPQRGRGDDTVVPPALRGGQHGSLQHGGSR